MIRRPPIPTLFPSTTPFRSALSPADAATLSGDRSLGDFYERALANQAKPQRVANLILSHGLRLAKERNAPLATLGIDPSRFQDRKSTRLNSSHANISYAVFC